MKRLTIVLWIFSNYCFSQKQEVFRIDSIPQQGILLDKGWKWHAGDNPDFAKVDFDDSAWEGIDPLSDITKVYNIIHKGEIGWLRLKFKVNQVPKSALALQFRQSGASEIYLNENMIYKFGVLDNKNPQNIKSYNPNETPLALTLSQDSIQALAIRYAIQLKPLYATHYGNQNPILKLTLKPMNAAILDKTKDIVSNATRVYIRAAVFGILTILFFSLFLFFNQNKVNLYFSIYALLVCLCWSNFEKFGMPSFTDQIFWVCNLLLIIQAIGYMFLLTAVYEVLHKNKGWSFYLLLALSLICIFTGYQYYGWGWTIFGYIYLQLISLDIIRISIISIKSKTKGAWILTIGGLIYFICWITFSLQFSGALRFTILTQYLFDISMLIMSVSFAIFLGYDNGFTNNLLKQKLVENEALSEEKQQILSTQNQTLEKQVNDRTHELQHSLDKLKATQAQLIQSEKLASLGELTAGIAHEIQNPLNFVNNFSEVSNELLAELKGPLTPEGGILAGQKIDMDIISDLESNLEKISLHGKRASSIVKGMLEHSRTSTGEKELTDINILADEYLRLAYHGLRAKDKNFNADFKTELDPNLPKVNVIPQDIGRVLLNLINNAFQAPPAPGGGARLVVVKTFQIPPSEKAPSGGLGASVSDNGSGMSPEIKSKIFQPFFTTKPTGQGTGLGLSLAYDIVTKGHGGTIECESVEGVGTVFIVKLPIV